MKKFLSMILAVLMLGSLSSAAFADGGLTPDMVLMWLDEGEEASANAEEQVANGALRLAEMMVALDNVNLTTDDLDRAQNILDILESVDTPDEDNYLKIATGAIRAFDGLLLFSEQLDREGKYGEYTDQILDSFTEQDAKMENTKGQAVNALYQSVKLAALLAEVHCSNQDMVDQIEAGLTEFSNDEDACVTADDQLANGARWLCKMLTALTKLRSPDEDFLAEIEEMADENQELSDAQDTSLQRAAIWLYGAVHMTGRLAETA